MIIDNKRGETSASKNERNLKVGRGESEVGAVISKPTAMMSWIDTR